MGRPQRSRLSAWIVPTARFPPSPSIIRRRPAAGTDHQRSVFGLSAQACPTPAPGSITTAGRALSPGDRIDACRRLTVPFSLPPKRRPAPDCIGRARCMPGIIEPGHFALTASGETVVRLEQRLGYVHKGIDGLMTGASLARGVQLAGRTSGDSTVAYAYAFSARGRSRSGSRRAGSSRVPARAAGRTRAAREPSSATSAPSATMHPLH
jgi:hypothetical protein